MKRRMYFLIGYTIVLSSLTVGVIRVRAVQGMDLHRPFTVVILETQTLVDIPQPSGQTLIVAIREDGSRVDVRQVIGNKIVGSKIIVNVPAKTRIFVDAQTGSKTTYPMNERWLAKYINIPVKQVEPTVAQTTILGYRAIKETRKLDDTTWLEEWLAPDLDYFPLKSTIYFDRGQKVQEAISITPGEPNSNLFEVPPNYVERSPIGVFQELERINGKRVSMLDNPQLTGVLEDSYNKAQAKKR